MLRNLRNLFGGGGPVFCQQPAPASRPEAERIRNLNQADAGARLQNCAAEEYATPQKYLDGAEIPTFFQFQSNMVTDEDLKPGMLRNLDVDKRLTLPTRTHIRCLITSHDVLHAWAVPALDVKIDCAPGRINRIFMFIQREGVYYGQCSELCGSLHAFMPVVIEAVAPERYAKHAKKWYVE
mmetsp:Transcript_6768/g.16560  ORF Transcript_6768/g.16560 Transcript_6768/m.16560 type:complete len:181 (-) Transcript_6768:256-798(-)